MSRPRVLATRGEFLAGAGSLFVLGLAGCGGGAGSSSSGDSGSGGETRTIEHKFGSTELEGEPERVVSIGYNEHDFLYALGISPVAARYWILDEDDVIYPWAEEAAGDADPEILNMPENLNFESIAALEPDLIVGLYSGMNEEDYDTLSEIAPTVAQSGDYIDYGMPWQETTTMLGRAVGREERAEELVADLEERFEEARRTHPEFEGKSLAIATLYEGAFGVFATEDPRSRFFRSLGFEIPEEFDEFAGDSFYAQLSQERVDLLDADVLVWDQLSYVEGGPETIKEDPLISQLDAMREERAIYLEDDVELAFGWSTILSIPFALDGIIPMLESVVSGERTTNEETSG